MVNWKDLKRLLKIMEQHQLVELSIEEGGNKVTLKKSSSPVIQNVPYTLPLSPAVPSYQPKEVTQPELKREEPHKKLYEIKSPLVGTFYRSPKPGAPPFVNLNDKITKGQTLCIVEAMKVMNEIKAEIEGIIREICVKDGEPVDFGRTLFKVEISE